MKARCFIDSRYAIIYDVMFRIEIRGGSRKVLTSKVNQLSPDPKHYEYDIRYVLDITPLNPI
jgi:hypothetical protein